MKVGIVIGSIIAALVLCSSASAASNTNQQWLSQAQIDQGCVIKGNSVYCPPKPMETVTPRPKHVVTTAPMTSAKPQRITKHQPAPHARKSDINAEAKRRGKVIDPKGQGLNQAQIDAMERQRQLMWNATGGGMVYR